MSGHSRWSTIKRKKERTDAQKGKIFTKVGRELAVATREGGPDPEINFKLRECIAKAKSFNVPNENIERIIKKASSANADQNYESFSYEGYGPSGVAFIVDILTNNRNRSASNIRRCFDKYGGNLGTSGCVSFMFSSKGLIEILKKDNMIEEKLLEDALDSGAEDFKTDDESFFIITHTNEYENVKKRLIAKGYEFFSSQISMIPMSFVKIDEDPIKERIQKLIDALEDDDDVQNVWCNYEFT